MRVDTYVANSLKKFSRSSLKGLFSKSKVKVNDKIAKSGYKLRKGDVLTVDAALLNARPPKIDLPIIYEDEDVVVINKPEGVLTHSKGAINDEATVASWLREHVLKHTPSETLDPGLWALDSWQSRAGIVHRLDRATSGVIITAKNTSGLAWLQKQFSEAKAKKQYLAVVDGEVRPPDAVIDAPIARNSAKPQTFKVASSGRPAKTEYHTKQVIEKDKKIYSLLDLIPTTGRTHQIRVHLKYIGHPVAGDPVYGRPGEGLMLHARSLEITLPSRQRKIFTAPIPERFKNFMDGPADAE